MPGGRHLRLGRASSTYVREPPYFDDMPAAPPTPDDIRGARVLALLGDTRHHRPHLAGRLDQAATARPAST